MEQQKITDLIEPYKTRGKYFTSFELIPNENLSLTDLKGDNIPLFFSIVWKMPKNLKLSDINEQNVEEIPAIKLASRLSINGETVVLHICCANMNKYTLNCILNSLQKYSIKNLLIMRGDDFKSTSNNDFNYVNQMITYIREKYGSYFSLGIVGFPDNNSNHKDYLLHFEFLKRKVDAGADFIITQMFFEARSFVEYVNQCRKLNIQIPIIPGLCLFSDYSLLTKIVEITNVTIPQSFLNMTESAKNNSKLFQKIMEEHTKNMLQTFSENKSLICGIHWFTMNKIKPIIDFCSNNSLFNNYT